MNTVKLPGPDLDQSLPAYPALLGLDPASQWHSQTVWRLPRQYHFCDLRELPQLLKDHGQTAKRRCTNQGLTYYVKEITPPGMHAPI